MTDEEVNKIIADYMELKMSNDGTEFYNGKRWVCFESYYTESLDALVPVWEKLEQYAVCVIVNELKWHAKGHDRDKTIQQVAAHATADVIRK